MLGEQDESARLWRPTEATANIPRIFIDDVETKKKKITKMLFLEALKQKLAKREL